MPIEITIIIALVVFLLGMAFTAILLTNNMVGSIVIIHDKKENDEFCHLEISEGHKGFLKDRKIHWILLSTIHRDFDDSK